ncbi:acyl-CoA dehydrogenase family protein [Kineococcus sp. SYSU DK018]|uniref:acyl-CoA dehydrogenase family protein n=1 Tax=Kineococcus sp. SYSU DK018 TaxID=3383139 RepID=UPI003D7D008A
MTGTGAHALEPGTAADLRAVAERFAVTAAAVDAGERDVREGLRLLGRWGLLAPSGAPGDRLAASVAVLRAVASASLADAFSAWSQTVVVEYLERFPPPGGGGELPAGLRAGTACGATALAPALADVAGGPPVPVVATPTPAGSWRLDGELPWASNLFDDAALVLPARTPDGGRLVALVRLGAPGVHLRPVGELLALNSTGTAAVQLDGAVAGPGAVLARDLTAFVGACRPVMLLTQAALALGVADAALDGAATHLHGAEGVADGDHRELLGERDRLAARLGRLAREPGHQGPTGPAAARLDALHLVARAVTVEGLLAAGAGYRAAHPAARRRREAAFLPVQAPGELQLRRVLAGAAAR